MEKRNKMRRCPRCGGNLFLYNDFDGWYEQCLQCSFVLYTDVIYQNKEGITGDTTSEISQNTVSAT